MSNENFARSARLLRMIAERDDLTRPLLEAADDGDSLIPAIEFVRLPEKAKAYATEIERHAVCDEACSTHATVESAVERIVLVLEGG